MKTKVIVPSQRGYKDYNPLFGCCTLYPEGTIRIVKKYFIFNKNLNGIKKRGWCIVKQKASLDIAAGFDGAFSFNKWIDIEFLNKIIKSRYDLIRSDDDKN